MRDAYESARDSEFQIRACRAVADEVNQPLTAIGLHVAAARKWLGNAQPDIERALASLMMIDATATHANHVVRNMRELMEPAACQPADIDLGKTVAAVLELLAPRISEQCIRVTSTCTTQQTVIRADAAQLQQLIMNIVTNAIEALSKVVSKRQRRIDIVVARQEHGTVEVAVRDNGPGIMPEHVDHIFAPWFTTRPPQAGMGLAVSQAIARIHGGGITHEAQQPHGARFTLVLPVNGVVPGHT